MLLQQISIVILGKWLQMGSHHSWVSYILFNNCGHMWTGNKYLIRIFIMFNLDHPTNSKVHLYINKLICHSFIDIARSCYKKKHWSLRPMDFYSHGGQVFFLKETILHCVVFTIYYYVDLNPLPTKV